MALPMIETGYKPEFGLGAVYQGFNAGNADMSAQEELIKQFLANQREQQMQPLDVQGKVFANMQQDLLAQQSQAQNNPAMLQSFVDSKQAGYDKAVRENELGKATQPYDLAAAPLLGQRKVADADVSNRIVQLETQIAATQNPLERMALTKQRNELVGTHGYTPEHWGAIDKENVKGGWDYDKAIDVANINASATRDAANVRGAGAGGSVAAKLAMDTTKEINVLEAQLTKLGTKEGEQAFNEQFLKVPPEQRQQMYQQMVADVKNKLTQARANRDHYVVQSGITLPQQSTQQPAQPNTPTQTLAEVRALYPGVADDKLKAAYKQKHGVDLK